MANRIKLHYGTSEDFYGYFAVEAEDDETWDWDIDEPRDPQTRAIEVPIVFGERQR